MAKDLIKIHPNSKRNQFFLLILGTLLLVLSVSLAEMFWFEFRSQMILLILASIVVFISGVVKFTEPNTTYRLSKSKLIYQHRMGKISLNWHQIVRVTIVKSFVNGTYLALPYIGIKLVDMGVVAQCVSPRLANKLLHEQKELIKLAFSNDEISLQESLIQFEPYQLNNKQYKGPLGAWLYRCELLNRIYGVHIFFPEDSFDRSKEEFLSLLNQCKQQVLSEVK